MNKIAKILKKQGRSILWIAEKVDINVYTFRNYTSNSNQPSNETLKKIAKILEVKMEDLIV